MSFTSALKQIERGQNLTAGEARAAFDDIFAGSVGEGDLATFLLGLCKKGETPDELLGAVQSMRAKAITIHAPDGAMDIVGTGGDQLHTLNISTATALVVASCGVPVAKHGNRSVTSKSGSSDILQALGVNLEPSIDILERCLNELKICFLFAPRHHPAMKYVVGVRKSLGIRTIFNLLGPLTNPANVKRHLIGAYEVEWLGPMASVLKQLGSEHAWLVHGADDMDEITTTGITDIIEMTQSATRHFTLSPEQYGLPVVHVSALRGDDAAHNATELRRLMRGLHSPYRDIVLMNAGAALVVAGACATMEDGLAMAAHALNTGQTYNTLDKLVALTNQSAL